MRNFLALGLLIALSVPADAAALHHHRARHHVAVRSGIDSIRRRSGLGLHTVGAAGPI